MKYGENFFANDDKERLGVKFADDGEALLSSNYSGIISCTEQ